MLHLSDNPVVGDDAENIQNTWFFLKPPNSNITMISYMSLAYVDHYKL